MTTTAEPPDRATASQQGAPEPDHETQVQALARYAARARFEDLSAESRRLLTVHILDCLACCLAAPGAVPVNACRDQFGVRRRAWHHADRRRRRQPGLRRVLAHGAGPLRRLYGQLPRRDRDLPHCRQLRRRPDRRRAGRRVWLGPDARGRDRVHGPVPVGRPRRLHDSRFRPHRPTGLLPQRRRRAAAGPARDSDRPRDRDGRGQRRLLRCHPRQATVAVEGG